MLVLTVIQGPDKGKTFQLPDHEPQLLGRSSESLPLTDTTVSRRHAELTPDAGRWWLRDLSSQNGTYINGVRLTARHLLQPGDQIRTGGTLFVFGTTDDPETHDILRLLRPGQIDATVERAIPSNEDSIILAEPEPQRAAIDHLRVIYKLTTLVSQAPDRSDLLAAVMDLVFAEFRPERGFIVLSDPDSPDNALAQKPAVVKYATPPTRRDDARFNVSRTILHHAVKKGEGVLSTNAMNDPRFAAGDSVHQLHIRSAICAPIKHQARTFGAVYIDSTLANYTFTAEQLALMNAIGLHTGLALANAELQAGKVRAERLAAIGETVASLAHSVKNILQGMRGGADVVQIGLDKADLKVATGGWHILKRNLARIESLMRNMLAFSRPRTLEVELCSLPSLIEDCAALLHDQCAARQVALIIDADADIPPIALDPQAMHQALMNLMTNAVEAVDSRTGAVTVRASYTPADPRRPSSRPEARVRVIDNGPGFTDDVRSNIFSPFFSTKGQRGTGLGLAVTKRIVEQHHGSITALSAPPPDHGATFEITLPAETSDAFDPAATNDPNSSPPSQTPDSPTKRFL